MVAPSGDLCPLHARPRHPAPNVRSSFMDEVDLKLLEALQQNCRIENNELAALVGLSSSRCSRRRMLLEEAGVITGYHAAVANRAVGLEILAFLQVSLASHVSDSIQAFASLVQDMAEVQEAY